MTRDQAKRVLLAHRPGTSDAEDPEVAEALGLVRRDPELQHWMEQQQKVQAAFRETLRKVFPPNHGKDQLLQVRKVIMHPEATWRRPAWISAAAAVVLLLGITWFVSRPEPVERNFAGFRDRMVRTVIREYRMDVTTNKAAVISSFFDKESMEVDLRPTQGLRDVPLFGAGMLSWKGKPVAMVCFEPSKDQLLYLFAIEKGAVEQGPGKDFVTEQVSHLKTISWSRAEKVYVLAGGMEVEELKKYL